MTSETRSGSTWVGYSFVQPTRSRQCFTSFRDGCLTSFFDGVSHLPHCSPGRELGCIHRVNESFWVCSRQFKCSAHRVGLNGRNPKVPESVRLFRINGGCLRTIVVVVGEQNDAGTGRLKHTVSDTGCLRERGVDLAGNKSQARPDWVDGKEERLTRRHVMGMPAPPIPQVECRLRDPEARCRLR